MPSDVMCVVSTSWPFLWTLFVSFSLMATVLAFQPSYTGQSENSVWEELGGACSHSWLPLSYWDVLHVSPFHLGDGSTASLLAVAVGI